jgi:DDE superfamily endonuclease
MKKTAPAGACVLLSPDDARFPLGPTLPTTLGVPGYRPMVGTWDNKEQVYGLAALYLRTGHLTPRVLEQPARSTSQTGHSKQQRLQGAFAAHLQAIARIYPATTSPEVVITLDHAPGQSGARVEAIVAAQAQLRLDRFPSYSPQLNVLERFWRVLRHRAPHNRLCTSLAAVRTTLRSTMSYFHTMRHKVLSLIESPRKAKKEAKLAAA